MCPENRLGANRHRWSSAYRNEAGEIEEECMQCDEKRTGSKIPKHERKWLLMREEGRKRP